VIESARKRERVREREAEWWEREREAEGCWEDGKERSEV
jgi:hypothetical protein